jgi:predicted phosphodiesterase
MRFEKSVLAKHRDFPPDDPVRRVHRTCSATQCCQSAIGNSLLDFNHGSFAVKRFFPFVACATFIVCVATSYAFGQENRQRRGDQAGRGGSGLGNYEKPPKANEIPDHPFDLILGRPTDSSIEMRILHNADGHGRVEYRPLGQRVWQQSDTVPVASGKPFAIVLKSLTRNTAYQYRWVFQGTEEQFSLTSEEMTFHTQRDPGSRFAFSVTADSHLDENSSGEVYLQTLHNALASQPDFHLELGDTFMTGKYVKPEYSYGQYLAQRYYLSHLCSSAPLFFVLGNHDGESNGRNSLQWASSTRKSLFPNPQPNLFYTGNQAQEPEIGFPEDYYAWHWGDAQFIVLDPYRYTVSKRRGGGGQGGGGQGGGGRQGGGRGDGLRGTQNTQDSNAARNHPGPNESSPQESNWYWTLGDAQYQWLTQELDKPAKYRFVFIHHLVGGALQNQRGGIEVANLWEWGGRNLQGDWEFDQYRPGWGKPLHQMLVDSGVSVVFHGHDHLFVKQDLDGIVYQEVPQPSHSRAGNTRTASEYGYIAGEIQPSSGYVRVRVDADTARVDYVRTYFSNDGSAARNGEVTFSYEVKPK